MALAIVAGLLGSCARPPHQPSGCSGVGGSAAPVASEPATSQPPLAVDEALWVVDGSGALRAFDGRTNRVTASVDLGRSAPYIAPALVTGGALVWAYRFDTGVLALVDPAAASITARVTVPPVRPYTANRLLCAHGALWIAQPGRLWRITPAGVPTSYDLPAAFAPSAMTGTARWLWLADGKRLLRVDPAGPASTTETVLADGVRQLLDSSAGLYATGVNTSEIRELDPATGAVRSTVALPGHELVTSMVDAGTQLWATGSCGDVLRVTDRLHPTVVATKVSDVSQDLPAVAASGSLWVGDEARSQVVRVSLQSGRVLARMPFAAADPDDPAFGIVAGRDSVWVVDGNLADGVSRVDPATGRVTRLAPTTRTSTGLSAVVSQPPRTAG